MVGVAIKAITFDFWRTLFRESEREERAMIRVRAFAEAANMPEADVAPALEAASQAFLMHHIERQQTLRPEDAVRMTAEQLGITMAENKAAELTEIFGTAILDRPPVPIDDAFAAVEHAAQLVPIGIVSDSGMSPGTSLRQLLRRHGFSSLVTHMVFSDEQGVAKPQAPMFHEAARGLGVRPDELLHIGDLQPTDIVGVQNVGGVAGLFAGDNTRFYGNTTAEHSYRSWREFIDRVPELGLESAA
jgi:putative hydrolase of the HAD superfamily